MLVNWEVDIIFYGKCKTKDLYLLNRTRSTVHGLSLFFFLFTISPASENILSHGTEEAGVHKHSRAR